MSQKELILKELYFGPKYTTEIYFELAKQGHGIGIKSCINRLQDAQREGKIVGEVVEGRREKRWKLKRYDKKGNGMLL